MAPQIDNYPGFPEGIKGNTLVELMQQQAQRLHAQFRLNEEVVGLNVKTNPMQVTTRKQTYTSPAIIIATGTQRRKLRVPGETEFLGRGVSYCAICDGPFFRNRTVAVVGNNEEAAIDALSLADLAKHVT
jgi:thioredoxin reductase (NADPH)